MNEKKICGCGCGGELRPCVWCSADARVIDAWGYAFCGRGECAECNQAWAERCATDSTRIYEPTPHDVDSVKRYVSVQPKRGFIWIAYVNLAGGGWQVWQSTKP